MEKQDVFFISLFSLTIGLACTNLLVTFFIQIMIAYIIAMPTVWWLMQHWLEQFVERAETHITLFMVPLLVVGIVSLVTVSLHTLLAAKSNPLESLKTE